ncbi:hypothetical protein Q5P01_011059 [Channa striata]|uniref:Ig-like domain-containing protein n=1 Tax=Channa striata TaxID=64152 RepID=A0AA88MWA5_CHASR|nr:hypothetical protein Q5P01_011059 [Channa striata]
MLPLEVCRKMAGFSRVLLTFCVLGYIFSSRAWQVKMPSHIKGLLGSCLVIPCSFDYYHYPPQVSDRVVWYQYVSRGYPLVYDSWYPNDVIGIFKGKTHRLHRDPKSCTLVIYPITWSHHRQKIYTWVDPEHVGRSTYRFFDTTVTIEVTNTAEKPQLMIFGDKKVGKSVQVECSVYHTCSSHPPTLTLNIPLKHGPPVNVPVSDGRSRTTLTTTMDIIGDHQTVECSVQHFGGLNATTSETLSAECSFSPLTISPTSVEFLEGHESQVTCTALYTCPKDIPNLTWNYNTMPASTDTRQIADAQWRTVSTLKMKASAKDHGGSLTCNARFNRGQRQEKSITLRVKKSMLSHDWSFTTPGSITGMKGSCVIIPCSFTYVSSQPPNLRVIWYLYQSNEYPAVFDQRKAVIRKFDGKTSLIGSVGERNCSLKIEKLEMSHNQDRLYPWVDVNPITSYHTLDSHMYEKTTQLIVSDQAQQPQLSIVGILRVGEQSKVSCSVQHTCVFAPPTLNLNGISGQDVTVDTLVSDGIWQRTVERTWTVQETDQSVECAVTYSGGQRARSELRLNAECPYEQITMNEPPGEVTEGVAKSVICSVTYKCEKNKPAIEWNYNDMQSSLRFTKMSGNTHKVVSNLTFIGSMDDNGKSLTCTARFITGTVSASENLVVKKYVKPADELYVEEGGVSHVLEADVPFRFSALTESCVVIPCSFQPQADVTLQRGIWFKKTGGVVFHKGRTYVTDHFRDRTRMLGELNEGNCSLEIDHIKPFDNGPFCFRAEKDKDVYRFNNSCVFIVMRASPENPVMTSVPPEVDAGSTLSVSCSVKHTCPSHPPVFSWSVQNLTSEDTHSLITQGLWETTSTITFVVAVGDGVKSLNCTATFWRDKAQVSTVKLNVKGSLMYQMRSSLPLGIPVSVVVLIVIIVAVWFGVSIYRKRKRTEDSLSPPPRPEKRRSLWDRLSRRNPDNRERPPRPEKRRSIWGRFSSAEDDRVGWQNERNPRQSFWRRFSRRQGDAANLSVGYLNNSVTVDYKNHTSKPRFPSPKNNRRTPRSARPEDY